MNLGLVGCKPDVVNNGVYCEFKSWSNIADKTADKDDPEAASSSSGAFSYFKNSSTGNSFKQFKALLAAQQVDNLSKIAYYFDAGKLAGTDNETKANWVKGVFQEMMLQNGALTTRGEEIWTIISGKPTILLELDIETQAEFVSHISNVSNSFYNFIYVK